MSGYPHCITFTVPENLDLLTSDAGPRLLLALAQEAGCLFGNTERYLANPRRPVANDLSALSELWIASASTPAERVGAFFYMWLPEPYYLDVNITLDLVGRNHLWIGFSDNAFGGDDEWSKARFEKLLQICCITYRELQVVYGFGPLGIERYPLGWQPSLTEPDKLYDVNFFGRSVVDKLGRQVVLSVPAWRTELLEDGGALVVMCDVPFRGSYTRKHIEEVVATAEQLGLKDQPGIRLMLEQERKMAAARHARSGGANP